TLLCFLLAGCFNFIRDLLGSFCRVGGFQDWPTNHQIGGSNRDSILWSDHSGLISGRGPGWTHSRSHDGESLAQRLAQLASLVGRGDQASTTAARSPASSPSTWAQTTPNNPHS